MVKQPHTDTAGREMVEKLAASLEEFNREFEQLPKEQQNVGREARGKLLKAMLDVNARVSQIFIL